MKIEIIAVYCVVALIPMIAWGQSNNNQTTRSKLRIAIPVRQFSKFVVIERDPITGENNYSGFSIEVFKAVISALPSPVSYELVAFAKPDGTMNGTFDDMLKAVQSKDYDGAIGDISILYYRTQLVDFTMPYMESSITMLVAIKPQPTNITVGPSLIEITNASSITTFVITAIVVLTYLAIVICTARMRKRDQKLSMHRALLMISLFVIFTTLLACYILSEASSLTSQDRNGTVKTFNQLIRMNSNVGYREGSFIVNLLRQKGISDSKLISLKSEDEMVDMLSKGTSKGGVDAIVANAPNLKLLQSTHCDVFTTVPTTSLQATGFGFAFGKGSDLVGEVSKAILKIVDKGELGIIQDRTIGSLDTCRDDPSNLDVGALSLAHRRRSIFIAGIVVAAFCVIVSLGFLCWSFAPDSSTNRAADDPSKKHPTNVPSTGQTTSSSSNSATQATTQANGINS